MEHPEQGYYGEDEKTPLHEFTVDQLRKEIWKREIEAQPVVYLESYEGSALAKLDGTLMMIDRWVISAGSEEAFKLRLLLDMLEDGE